MLLRKLWLLTLSAGATFAQLPQDTLRSKVHAPKTLSQKFLEENPGAVEVKRTEHSVHFRRADGARLALISQHLNWRDPQTGQIMPLQPALWTLDNGWRLEGGPVKARIVRSGASWTFEFYHQRDDKQWRTISFTIPAPSYDQGLSFSFAHQGLTWRLTLTETGFDLTAAVANRQRSQTYSLPQAARLLDLSVDSSTGHLTGNGFGVSRAVMVRADRKRTPCSAWRINGGNVSFTCDDSDFPAEAFPYLIDPSGSFYPTAAGDDAWAGAALYGTSGCPAWPGGLATQYLGDTTTTTTNQTYSQSAYYYPSCWKYSGQSYIRFDTSSIPSGATLTSASVSVYAASVQDGNQDFYGGPGCSVQADWYASSNWPLTQTEWNLWGGGNAVGSQDLTGKSAGWYSFPLANLANIPVGAGAYAGLKWSVPCEPLIRTSNILYNEFTFYSFDNGASTKPYLSITYDNAPVTLSCTSVGPQGVQTSATSGTLDFFAYGVQNAASVFFPTWSDVNGQDDIIWYAGSNLGGGTWKGSVDLASHRSGNPDYGGFAVHVWMNGSSGESVFCGATSFTRTLPGPPSCTSVGPQGVQTPATSGTLDFYAYGVQNATSVFFPTWSDVNGQDDIIWYPGSNLGGGTWRGSVNLASHRPGNPDYGGFQVHVWMDGSQWTPCGATSFTRTLPPPSCSSVGPQGVQTSATSGTLDFYAYGVQNATSVSFPTWSDVNGQDDIIWYAGSNLGGGTWKGSVNLASHRPGNPDYGSFSVHVWMDGSQWTICGGTSFTRVVGPPPPLTITTASPLPSGTWGVAYSPLTLAATGGTPPYSWSKEDPPINGNLLPSGLSLSGGGVLSGTPTRGGQTYGFWIRVTDSLGATATKTFTLAIGPAVQPIHGPSRLEVGLSYMPFDEYDLAHPASSKFPKSCPPGSSIRSCFQTVLAELRAQGVSGVRIFFGLCGSDSTPLVNCGQPWTQVRYKGNLSPPDLTWINRVKDFFGDVRNAGIQNITLTPAHVGGAPSWKLKSETRTPISPPPPAEPIHCADAPNTIYFYPGAPLGYKNVGTEQNPEYRPIGAVLETGNNNGYNCAPINPIFVGWQNLYDVINAMLAAAAEKQLMVSELDFEQELNIMDFPALARFIVDNAQGDSGQPNVRDALRYYMGQRGFDPGRVTWSAPWHNSTLAGVNCTSVYAGFARTMGADQIASAIGGGLIGRPSDPSPPVGPETGYLTCNGSTSPMFSMSTYGTQPNILDVHLRPCVGGPGTHCVLDDAAAAVQSEARFDFDAIVNYIARFPLTATVMLGETHSNTDNGNGALCEGGTLNAPAETVAGFNDSALRGSSVVFRPWMQLQWPSGDCHKYPGNQRVNFQGSGPYTPTQQ